jgi:hypothetical protein
MATSLIPSGQTSFPLVSGKSVQGLTIVVSTDSDTNPTSPTYTSTALVQDSINNSFTKTLNTGDFALVYATDKIPTTQVTDPKAVKLVGNYVTATNSHSIYKGNQLVPTGKVNVGNGSNGLESKVVENSIVGYDYEIYAGATLDFISGNTYYVVDDSIGWSKGSIIEWIGSTVPAYTVPSNWVGSSSILLGYTDSTPTHSTISLDNSPSPAVKLIETIAEDDDGMAHYQLFAQTMVTNAGAYDGDDNQFTQLTNGTLTDDNANVVKTICASIPLNKYIGDK